MSNAMRMGKRTLAGVAAGALGLALIPFVGATSASAAGDTVAATVSPVRSGAAGTIPAAFMTFKATSVPDIANDDTLYMVLSTAPTADARIRIFDNTGATLDDSVSLNDNNQEVGGVGNALFGAATTADDSFVRIAADTAGGYAGALGNGEDTVTFSFSTTGTPTSMELTPATQTVLVGATGTLQVTLKDASGNVTQPATVDAVSLSDNTDDTISSTENSTTAITSLTSTNLATGQGTFYLRTVGNPAGTTTVTATPAGTLAGSGVTAQTASVVKSGTISEDAIVNAVVTAPTLQAAVNPAATTVSPTRSLQVPSNSSSITIAIDDTTANAAGTQLRFGAVLSAGGTINGEVVGNYDDTVYVDVTTDADKKASMTLAIGGNGLLNGSIVEVTQVDISNAPVSSGGKVTITQTNPAVQASSISVSPDDSVVAALGATTPVTVSVDDSFGSPQAGWVVNAFRNTQASGTVIGTATTNAQGEAVINVTNASGATDGTVESYSFQAVPPVGSPVAKDNPLQITYTTSGEITSLAVAGLGGTVLDPTSVNNTTTTITTAPLVTVPFGGTASTISTSSFTVASGATAAAGNGGQVAAFGFTLSTRTSVTAQVALGSEGVFVSDSASTAWDAGKTTVTVSADDTVYVFATKAGTHSIEFTAGGKSVTIPVKAQTSANAAYNVAITPESQRVGPSEVGTATLTVTDVFGNPVQASGTTTGDDTGAVTVSASGQVLLAGFNTSQNLATGADGTATITFISLGSSGTGTLAATPKTGTATPAWQTGYTPPTNAPAPVTSAAATVTVGTGPTTASIILLGERGEVRGRPGVIVEGVTQGIAGGTVVRPFIKFPGQDTYTMGNAQRTVTIVDAAEELGEFAWQRRTGKKIYVYFRTADGAVQSSRIIIPGR